MGKCSVAWAGCQGWLYVLPRPCTGLITCNAGAGLYKHVCLQWVQHTPHPYTLWVQLDLASSKGVVMLLARWLAVGVLQPCPGLGASLRGATHI